MECKCTTLPLYMNMTKLSRFLLAQLHLDSLAGKTSPKAIRSALETLPTGSDAYDHAYKGAMERIEGQHIEQEALAKRVLSWITFSKRPLATAELQHALAVEFGTRVLDQANFTPIELMVSVCAGLVTADGGSGMIRLIHYTTQEYFERTRNYWFPDAETEITKICVTYLSFDIFGSQFCQTNLDLQGLLASNGLFHYAACNWGHHAYMSSVQEDVLILDFLESGTNLSVSALVMVTYTYDEFLWWPKNTTKPRMESLHITAYFGLRQSTAALLDRQYSVSPKDAFDCTPLYYAADKGHYEVAKLLLDWGADPNIQCTMSPWYKTPLSCAMRNEQLALVIFLLEKNADPNIRGGPRRWTVLHHAAKKGYMELAKLLLQKNANLDIQEDCVGCSSTPLHYAMKNGHLKLAKLLIDNNADPGLRDEGIEYGSMPLHYAAKNGYLELVELLLQKNVDPNIQDGVGYGSTPLHHAAESGHLELVKLLLEKGADPNIQDCRGYGSTPLHHAAENGHLELVKLLLKKGADPNIQVDGVGCGSTALHYATRDGHLELVKVLLDNNANPNLQDGSFGCGLTPLQYAVKNGYLELVDLLLGNNASADIKDEHGLTPLHYAAKEGNQEMVRLMLHKNADSTIQCDNGLTPLCYARQNGFQQMVDLLVNTVDHNGQPYPKRPRLQL